ncbi:hypothetical protein PFISCL1PPCAC_21066, partial [Pristionchus fissidentatus]
MEPKSSLMIVEEWRRKTRDFSRQSNEVLFSLFERTFDTMTLVFQSAPDHKRIQRSLAALEVERNMSFKDDEERKIALREISYGFIQSLQFVLHKQTAFRDQSAIIEGPHLMAQNSPLWIVEEWKRKTHEFARQSTDVLLSLFERAFEIMALTLEQQPDYKRIHRVIASLELERTLSIQDDEEREFPLRDAIYG